jgi:NADH-quinone oxidoreductase subunit N
LNAPLIWIVLPIFISMLLLFNRKSYYLNCLIQIAICALVILSAVAGRFLPIENAPFFSFEISPQMNILGRSLLITTGLKTTLIIFYGFLGLWSVSLFIFKIVSNLVPLGLAFIGLLIAALAVEPFTYSALILEIAVLISIPMVQRIAGPNIKGLSRYFIYFTIGMPFVLLAGWYLAGGEITPVNDSQLIQAALMLGFGFVFWLAVFPLQSWVPLLAEETKANEGLFILTILPVAVVSLLLNYINGLAWLRSYATVFQALRLFGLIMVIAGSVWIYFEKKIKKAIGYLILVSNGLIILSISLNSSNGYIISTYFMLLRLLCFFGISWILVLIDTESIILNINSLKGFFHKNALHASFFFASLFSIIGFPMTIGFPVMQSFLSEFDLFKPRWNLLVIFSLTIMTVTFLKWVFTSLSDSSDQESYKWPLPVNLFILVCGIGLLVVSIFPNLVYPYMSGIVNDLQFLVR